MSQAIFPNINPATTSGTQLATLLNGFKDAVASGFSGDTRPPNLQAGGYWIDVSEEDAPDYLWKFKIYDGTDDIEIFRINLSTNSVTVAAIDSLFEILRVSADTVGAVMKVSKRRVANNGQVLDGDVVGEYQFVGRGSDSSNPVVARLKAVASDDMTGSAAGGYLVFEVISDGQVVLTEAMTLRDGKLGIGTTAPEHGLHVVSSTGGKIQRTADDASASSLKLRKRRIAGTGAVQSGDVISALESETTDDASAASVSADIRSIATENHTASAQGTDISFRTTPAGSATKTEKMRLGDASFIKGPYTLEALTLESQDVATTATIAALSATKAVVKFTGSTATSLQGISATGQTKTILLHNKSTATVTVEHEDAGATAANRFDLPLGRDILLKEDESVEFFYDSDASRWKLKSGSGSGSGGGARVISGTRAAPLSITAGGGITASATDIREMVFVQGSGGHVTVTANPQISAGFQVGQEILIRSRNNDQTLTLVNGNGLVLNGDWTGAEDDSLAVSWDGTNWVEEYRSN